MEEYRTEEEQVEALRRWWNENGRSTIVAIIVALAYPIDRLRHRQILEAIEARRRGQPLPACAL